MIRRLRQFLRASRTEKREVFAAAKTLMSVAVELRLLGARRKHGWTTTNHAAPPATVEQLAQAESIHRLLIAACGLFPLKPTCLTRSVALHRRLKRHGVPSSLRIGVRKEAGEFAAHAWVECGDVRFDLGDRGRPYQAFDATVSP